MARTISQGRADSIRGVLLAWDELLEELKARPACEGRWDMFVGYSSWRGGAAEPAQKICMSECPLVRICRERARLETPFWGVWGGEIWSDGRRVARAPRPSADKKRRPRNTDAFLERIRQIEEREREVLAFVLRGDLT